METSQDILRRRARHLAQVAEQFQVGEQLQVVEFTLGTETYAVALAQVKKVSALKDVVPLPGTPPFVLGITTYAGQILPVFDLRVLFELPVAAAADCHFKIVILQAQHLQLAIVAEQVLGSRDIAVAGLQLQLPTLTGVRARYLKGISGDQTIVLDVDALLTDEMLVI